jgi:hypothetical protein
LFPFAGAVINIFLVRIDNIGEKVTQRIFERIAMLHSSDLECQDIGVKAT